MPVPKTQTQNLGQWYTATCPDVLLIGTEAEIKVTYRGIAEKTTLCCDLHCLKADGSSGGSTPTIGVPIRRYKARPDHVPHSHPRGGRRAARHARGLHGPGRTMGQAFAAGLLQPIPVVDPDPGYSKYLKEVKHNKSWIAVDWSVLAGPLVEGDKIEIPIEYYLDPAEHYRETTLSIEALGPRVPKPDAPKPVSFENTQHIWYGAQSVKVEPGRGQHLFPLTVPNASSQNDLLLLALFSDGRGKRWPWDVRAGAWFARKGGYFELETDKPGNLFTLDEPVRIVGAPEKCPVGGREKDAQI